LELLQNFGIVNQDLRPGGLGLWNAFRVFQPQADHDRKQVGILLPNIGHIIARESLHQEIADSQASQGHEDVPLPCGSRHEAVPTMALVIQNNAVEAATNGDHLMTVQAMPFLIEKLHPPPLDLSLV